MIRSRTDTYVVECGDLPPDDLIMLKKVATEGGVSALKKWAEEHPELEIKIIGQDIEGNFTKEYLSDSMTSTLKGE